MGQSLASGGRGVRGVAVLGTPTCAGRERGDKKGRRRANNNRDSTKKEITEKCGPIRGEEKGTQIKNGALGSSQRSLGKGVNPRCKADGSLAEFRVAEPRA